MIVLINEQSTLSAVQVYLEPSTPPDERKADLACLIAIPPDDRQYDPQRRVWTIKHPARYAQILPVLKPYIRHMSAKVVKSFTEK
ncbi:MAG: hypothetical protein RBT34_06725 [Anaerolineaceae bacterium]|jgi:hypothetical protein|nr:hypothetical protein [Anaerolineaceae bacterium]